MPDALRVVLAEDNYLVREGTRRLLQDSGAVEVLAAVGTAEELHDAVRRISPDAVITDIRMPPGHHMEGIEAARAIRADHPRIGVVVLSQHTDQSYAFELLRDGAAGLAYLLKDRLGDVEDLVPRAARGQRRRLGHRPRGHRRPRGTPGPDAPSPLTALTARELDVLREMAQGRTNAGIEAALHLSASTVEKHVNAIFTKLQLTDAPVHRRVAAVLAFLKG